MVVSLYRCLLVGRLSRFFRLLFVAFCFALLVGLSCWQVKRAEWKAGIKQQIARYEHEVINDLSPDSVSLLYRHARLQGIWLPQQFFLQNRFEQGQPGYYWLQPLALNDGKKLMVNIGWLPQKTAKPAPLSGDVLVDGWLYQAGKPNIFFPNNQPANNVWYYIDPSAMEKGAVPEYYLKASTTEAANIEASGVKPLGAAPILRDDHLSYAIFWGVMAFIWLIVAWKARLLR
ncbi:MAG: SURF1 family protein [Alphaproteobacteria bacterium]